MDKNKGEMDKKVMNKPTIIKLSFWGYKSSDLELQYTP